MISSDNDIFYGLGFDIDIGIFVNCNCVATRQQ